MNPLTVLPQDPTPTAQVLAYVPTVTTGDYAIVAALSALCLVVLVIFMIVAMWALLKPKSPFKSK